MNNVIYAKPDYNTHRLIQNNDPATGAPIAVVADSTNLATVKAANARGPLDCNGFETVFVAIKLTGGTNATLQPLEAIILPDGTWHFRVLSANIGPLTESSLLQEVTVNGGRVFFRLDAVTGGPTEVEILVAGGEHEPAIPGVSRRW